MTNVSFQSLRRDLLT